MSKLARIGLVLLVAAALPGLAHAQTCQYTSLTVDLVAGQHSTAGSVFVSATAAQICVTYQAEDDWRLVVTHLAVADSLSGIPQTRSGNPRPGQFPYSTSHDPAVSEFTYCVANSFGGDPTLYIATHAEVQRVDEASGQVIQRETAWSGEEDFSGSNWATYFVYRPGCIQND